MNEHIANLVFFLLWAERSDPNMMWGGVKVSDAIDSLSAIIGCKPEELRGLIE
jgi:hypothetical protein